MSLTIVQTDLDAHWHDGEAESERIEHGENSKSLQESMMTREPAKEAELRKETRFKRLSES